MYYRFLEERIEEAVRSDEWSNLEGQGAPVDVRAYFATPEEFRVGYSVLKNAGFVPGVETPDEAREAAKSAIPSFRDLRS